jgi:4-amino-4-deoxy-L-arabinose transferase-like glycosyltransferase
MKMNKLELLVAPRTPWLGVSKINRPYVFPVIVGVLTLLGALIIWLNSPQGVVVGYDSFFYISAAKNLISGAGLGRLQPDGHLIPLTHYPPLYSWCLAGLSLLLRGDLLGAAKWLAGLTFGVNIILFGWIALTLLRSRWAALAVAFFALVSPVFIAVNIEALTEGLFLNLLVVGLFILAKSLKSLEWRRVITASILVALACLTRYVGSTLIVVGLAAILFISSQPWRKKLLAGAVFGLVSGVPLGILYLRNYLVTGSATNRIFEQHYPINKDYIRALTTITGWFFSVETQESQMKFDPRIWLVVIAGVVIFAAAFLWVKRTTLRKVFSSPDLPFLFCVLLVMFALVYAGSLWISRAFFDASTRWDSRILSPLYTTGALFTLLAVWNGFQLAAFRWRKVIFALAVLSLCVFYIKSSNTVVDSNRTQSGGGFTSLAWRNSETIQFLKELPPGWQFYTNNATVIYFHLWKPAFGIPEVIDSVKQKIRPSYPQDLTRMRQFLQQPESALVIFEPYGENEEYPPLKELVLGLEIMKKTKDGTIYVAAHP